MKRCIIAIFALVLLLLTATTAEARNPRGRWGYNTYSPAWYSNGYYYGRPYSTYVLPSDEYRSYYYNSPDGSIYYDRPGYYYRYYDYPRSDVYVNTPYFRWRLR